MFALTNKAKLLRMFLNVDFLLQNDTQLVKIKGEGGFNHKIYYIFRSEKVWQFGVIRVRYIQRLQ